MSEEQAKQRGIPHQKKADLNQQTIDTEKEKKAQAAAAEEGQAARPADAAAGEQAVDEQAAGQEKMNNLKDLTRKLEEESSMLKDQLLRKTADFENFRKRMFREKDDGIKYANAVLLSEIIVVIDDFERAIQSAGESKDFDSFHQGVEMIEKRLVSMLEKNWGLKRFSSTGEEFDPERHQAIALEESAKHEKSVVLEDYQKGYLLHDRVLRPAKVKVSKPASPEDEHKKQNNSGEVEE
jgi:molecular chaperone GrpE